MNFKPLKPNDLNRLKKYFVNQRNELCAYSLSSMLVWSNERYQTCGAVNKDALVVCVQFADRRRKPHLVLPLSPSGEYEPERLAEIARQTGIRKFHFIPEDYVERHGRKRLESLFQVTSHSIYHDYVYLAEDLASLNGNKYSKKRNLINQFHKKFTARGQVDVQDLAAGDAGQCLEFLEEWCALRDCGRDVDEDLSCEKKAVQNALTHWDLLEFKGITVRVQGRVRAFAIGSRLTAAMGVLNFEKADASIKGLYQFLDMEAAQRLFSDCTFINKESDMGIPGLAKAKQSYFPARMVHAYKLILR